MRAAARVAALACLALLGARAGLARAATGAESSRIIDASASNLGAADPALDPAPEVVVPHDHRLCLTWEIAGGALPASSVTRCFAPFEWGPEVQAAHLSPGRHSVSLSLAPPPWRAGDRVAVPLSSAVFTVAFDASVGVAVTTVVDAPEPETCPVLEGADADFVSSTAAAACEARTPGECATVRSEVRFLHASMAAAYGGGPRSEVLDYTSSPELGFSGIGELMAVSGVPIGASVVPPRVPLAFVARRLESHGEFGARACAALFRGYGSPAGFSDAACAARVAALVAPVRAQALWMQVPATRGYAFPYVRPQRGDMNSRMRARNTVDIKF